MNSKKKKYVLLQQEDMCIDLKVSWFDIQSNLVIRIVTLKSVVCIIAYYYTIQYAAN